MIFGPEFPRSQDELREGLYRLLQRSYARAGKAGHALAVYRSSFDLFGRLCAERWAQETAFANEAQLVRRFLREARLPAPDPGAVVAKSLLLHSAAATWRRTLQRMSREPFLSLCEVNGAERLRAALGEGRGAMLVHRHTLFASVFWSWLEHSDIAPGVTLGHWAWEKGRQGEREDPKRWIPEVARELKEASLSLRAGGLAHVFGDGIQGGQAIEVEFCGRKRGFRPTFAELVSGSGAAILTAGVVMGTDGRLAMHIGRPLAADPALPRAERNGRLVREYAERVRRQWERDPAQIPWNDMNNHLRLPPA